MNAFDEILSVVIAMARDTDPYATITTGALPTDNSICMAWASGAPASTFLDKGMAYLDDQEVQPESLSVAGVTYSGGSSIGLSSNVTYESGGSASQYGKKKATAWGGYGGGPAYGANGSDGEAGQATAGGNFAVATGGKGGDGGNALPPAKAQTRGSGGAGGNGGGAPGSSGKAQVDNEFNTSSAPDFQANTNPGTPGNGSDGGEAADGVLLIYY